jgi:hypothetical protein
VILADDASSDLALRPLIGLASFYIMLRTLLRSSFFVAMALVTVATWGCEPPPEARIEPTSRQLTVFWSGALRGELLECDCPLVPGGLPRLATLIDRERALAPDLSLLVEVGDVAGDPVDDESVAVESEIARRVRAELAYEAMGLIGYDLYLPGERDLTLGAEVVIDRVRTNGGALLSSNLWWRGVGEPLGQSTHLIETEYGAVAVIGVIQPLSEIERLAARAGHGAELEVVDPAVALDLVIAGLDDDVALVLLFAHGEDDWVRGVLSQVSGVDICVVAHDDSDPRTVEEIGDTLLIHTARDGKSLGRLEIELRSDGTIQYSGRPYAPTEDLVRDPEVSAIVDALDERLTEAQAFFDSANQGMEHPSGGTYLGFSACGECHGEQVESWLSTPHVSAFQALQSIGWHFETACFDCHATGFGFEAGFQSRMRTPLLSGVTCEACHGPASRDVHDPPGESGYGAVTEETCRGCHDQEHSPDFDYESALPRVRH